jgi:hypothetical protein
MEAVADEVTFLIFRHGGRSPESGSHAFGNRASGAASEGLLSDRERGAPAPSR